MFAKKQTLCVLFSSQFVFIHSNVELCASWINMFTGASSIEAICLKEHKRIGLMWILTVTLTYKGF